MGAEPDDGVVDGLGIAVQVADEFLDAALVVEDLVLVVALVDELDADAGIEERQLAEPLGQHVVVEVDVGEDLGARLEANRRAALRRRPNDGQRRLRLAKTIFLLM